MCPSHPSGRQLPQPSVLSPGRNILDKSPIPGRMKCTNFKLPEFAGPETCLVFESENLFWQLLLGIRFNKTLIMFESPFPDI